MARFGNTGRSSCVCKTTVSFDRISAINMGVSRVGYASIYHTIVFYFLQDFQVCSKTAENRRDPWIGSACRIGLHIGILWIYAFKFAKSIESWRDWTKNICYNLFVIF